MTQLTKSMWQRGEQGAGQHDDYGRRKTREAARQAAQSAKGREIGPIPPIANPERREACRLNLRLFLETYLAEAIYLDWSDDHLEAIARIEEAVLQGALYAYAMPRGSGKTTLTRGAILWAASYAHRRYPFVIGANSNKAEATMESVKVFIRFLDLYAEDFPEISVPPAHLAGIANRASGQTCMGESTMIGWAKDRIVLATVPPPPNLDCDDSLAPTSGILIGTSGLDGEGIRGSVHTLTTGEQVRPDLVILDDPQTDASAKSPTQNRTREELVAGAVLGMAGPGRSIAAVMPCTVIHESDFVDRILDRQKHPLWRGTRRKLLRSMPVNMPAWDRYFQIYADCAQREPPDYTAANQHYLQHRDELDAGAEASWKQRHNENEISAIQHAMHLYFRDPQAFAAEYQNEPMPPQSNNDFLNADEIKRKQSGLAKGTAPPTTERITAYIDVQERMLYWIVVAWEQGFGGQIIDYGTYPEQNRQYYAYKEATRTLGRVHSGVGRLGAIYRGLLTLIDQLAVLELRDPDGSAVYRVERLLIDAGYEKGTVFEACRDTQHGALVAPAFGRGIRAGTSPMANWAKRPGEEKGHGWIRRTAKGEGVRYLLLDANLWKTRVHHALATATGDPGSLNLYSARPDQHQMLADHLTAETPTATQGHGREVVEWVLHDKGRDNHWLDCLAGAAAAASLIGVSAMGDEQPNRRKQPNERVSLSQLQKGRRT